MGPPEDLISAMQRWVEFTTFVETGTFQGNTAEWASARFEQVTTIELSTAYHAAAQERFRARANVHVLHGESPNVLREVVPTLTGTGLFWLDAHWSGLDTAGRESECPLLAEVAVINAARVVHIVLVDDARLFCAPPPLPHRSDDWPDLETTVAALVDGGRRHVVLFRDVFVAVPVSLKERLTEWIQSNGYTENSGGRIASLWKRMRS